MSLQSRLTSVFQAIGADIKALYSGKANIVHTHLTPVFITPAATNSNYWIKLATYSINSSYNDLQHRFYLSSHATPGPYTAEVNIHVRTHALLTDATSEYITVEHLQGWSPSNFRLVKSQTSNGSTPNVWEIWVQCPLYLYLDFYEIGRSTSAGSTMTLNGTGPWAAATSAGLVNIPTETILANQVGSNLRIKGAGTNLGDGGIYADANGEIWFANWSNTRGLRVSPGGELYNIFGGAFYAGKIFSRKDRTDTAAWAAYNSGHSLDLENYTGSTGIAFHNAGANAASLVFNRANARFEFWNQGGNAFNGVAVGSLSEQAITSSNQTGTYTMNLANGLNYDISASGNLTFAFSNVPTGAVTVTVSIYGNGNGYTITLPSGCRLMTGALPTSTNGKFISLTFYTVSQGASWWQVWATKEP